MLYNSKGKGNLPWRHRWGVQVQLYSFFNLGDRWEGVVKATPRRFYSQEKDTVPALQKNLWAPGQDWTSGENLARTSIRSPDRLRP